MAERTLANGKAVREWVFFEKRFEVVDTNDPLGDPVRIRWRLFHCPYFGIYVHKWLKPDSRSELHNHPWPFLSIMLKGAYVERSAEVNDFTLNRTVMAPAVYGVPVDVYHTVLSVDKPTWTLLFVGRTRSSWGYLSSDKSTHIPFDEHPSNEEFKSAMQKRMANAETS